jgi:energy-converting hydrogenase Eha subunit G
MSGNGAVAAKRPAIVSWRGARIISGVAWRQWLTQWRLSWRNHLKAYRLAAGGWLGENHQLAGKGG